MITSFEASHLVTSLGWGLLHFVWQGAAIGLVFAALLAALRRHSPNVRYVVACAGLALLLAAPIATTIRMAAEVPITSAAIAAPATGSVQTFTDSESRSVALVASPVATPWLAGWLPSIVGLWLFGVVCSASRLTFAWLAIENLRRRTMEMSEPLAAAVARVHAAMNLGWQPPVAESSAITSPLVVGWLRPLLVVPVSAVANLSPAQLETILAHEFAHLRRHDHIVNGIQAITETLLFYHPAVWWISGVVRREREFCSDDAVVAAGGDRVTFASALAALEEYRPQLTVAGLAASDGDLLMRIRRIVGVEMNHRSRFTIGPVVGTLAIVLSLAVGITARVNGAAKQPVAHAVDQAAAGGLVSEQYESLQRRYENLQQQSGSLQDESARLRAAQSLVAVADLRFRQALAQRDATVLNGILAEGFVATDRTGLTLGRSAFLQNLANLPTGQQNLQQSVQISGQLAVVTGVSVEAQGTTRRQIVFTRVWDRSGTVPVLVSSTEFVDPRPAIAPGMAATSPSQTPGRSAATAPSTAAILAPVSQVPTTASTFAMAIPPNAVRIGGEIREPRKVVNVAPVYPAEARLAGVSGVIIMELLLTEGGLPADLRIVRGTPMLDQAAIDAVRQWRYEPLIFNGAAVPVLMTITVNFSLAR